MLDRIEKIIAKIIDYVGFICVIVIVLLILNVFYDTMMRYIFKESSIGMQELEWHFFSVLFLFGIAYTLKEDGHVRVDVLYDKFSPKVQAIINIIGILVFVIPVFLGIIYGGIAYTETAMYPTFEGSPDPGGLPYRFIIKGSISIASFFIILSAIGFMLRNIKVLIAKDEVR